MKKKYKWSHSHHLSTLLRGILILLCLLGAIWSAHAQTVRIADGYPKIVGSNRLVAYGEPLTIAYRFTPQGSALTDSKVKITLPNDVEVESFSAPIGGITFTKTQNGQEVTLSGGTIAQNHEVEVQFKVKTTGCINPGVVTFQLAVLSGINSKASNSVTANAVRPILQIGLPAGGDNIDFGGTPTTPKTVTIYLKTASADKASSAQVTFTVSTSEITLSNFKLNTTAISAVAATLPDGRRTYTLTFASPANMGGSMIDQTDSKKITFNAVGTPSICGFQHIKAMARFPSGGTVCHTSSEQQITLAMGGTSGVPTLTVNSCNYVTANNSSASVIHPNNVPKNGTLTWVRTVLTNTGTTAIRSFNIGNCSTPAFYNCIDTSKIYIQIGSGPLKRIYPNKRETYGFNPPRQLKPAYSRMVSSFNNMTIHEVIPPGTTVTLYMATHNGDIFDLPDTNRPGPSLNGPFGFTCNSFSILIGNIKGFCAENTARLSGRTAPELALPANTNRLPLPKQIFKGQQTFTGKTHVHLGQIDQADAVFTVETPAWLTIEDMKITPNEDGTGTFPAALSFTPTIHSPQKRSIKIRATGTVSNPGSFRGYLHVTYKSEPCGAVNKEDTVRWTTDQVWSDATLPNTTLLKQPVAHICKQEGIGMDTFYLKRHTDYIGYKDTNNDGDPDNGTQKLPDADVDHTRFATDDRGSFHWKGQVEAGNTAYEYLYLPMEGNMAVGAGPGKYFIPNTSAFEVKVNGTAVSGIDLKHQPMTGNKSYFVLRNPSKFSAGATVEIKIDFTVNRPAGNFYTKPDGILSTLFKVSETSLADPFTQGKGADNAQVLPIKIHYVRVGSLGTEGGAPMVKFETRASKTVTFDPVVGGQVAIAPFVNEARYFYYLKKITYELPPGYTMDDQITVSKHGAPALGSKTLNSEPGSTPSRRTYDFSQLFQTSNPTGPLGSGKWRLWKDSWTLNPEVTLKINPSFVRKDTSTVTITRIFHNLRTGQDEEKKSTRYPLLIWDSKANFSIDAPPPYEVISYGPYTTGPRLKLENKTADALNDVWFYFSGKLKDVQLIPTGSGTPHAGQNINDPNGGCWVKVNDLASNDTRFYTPIYTSMVTACPYDSVTVYACSGFGASWAPNTTLPLNPNDDHIIDKRVFRIKPSTSATIDAAIVSDRDSIKASPNDASNAYTITASLNSNASDGMVKEIEMDLTVPIGQVYVPGSAEIEYPAGTSTPLPAGSAMEQLLVNRFGPASDDHTERSARLQVNTTGIPALGANLILPGTQGNPPAAESAKRKIQIRMKFRALCSTEIFKKIVFKGTMYAQNICGDPANGNGQAFVSGAYKPDINYDYDFETQIAPKSAGSPHVSFAFNEGHRRDTLQLEIKRHYGASQSMKANDYLEVLLPDVLDIDSTYFRYKGVSGSLATLDRRDSVAANTVASGVRTLKLPFPITEYNNDATKGHNSVIHCYVPLIYTPNGQDRAANPVDSIQASIQSTVTFKGGCPDQPMKLGQKSQKAALFTAVEWPHIAWIGDTARFEITSRSFDGKWYNEKTGGAVASNSNPWINIPTDTAMVGDTVFYFTPVINGTEYGNGSLRLPYRVRIWLRPWFIKNLDTMKYVCSSHDTLFVKAGGMDVSYKWYKDGDSIAGARDTFLVVRQPGSYHVMVNDTVTPPNIISSDTMNVYFREFPVITKELKAPIRDCERRSYDLNIETQGHHLLYQWYRNGLPIPGANQRSYRALAKDSSAFYRVTVKNLCGDSISSKQCYISFCDEKISGIGRYIQLIVPNTAETTPSAKGMLYVSSRQDFTFTVNAKKGYSVKYMNITTDSPIWTEFSGGIQRTMISDSVMQVRIRTVTSNLKVIVSGITPLANKPVIDNIKKVWGYKGKLYVQTERNEAVYIYTTMGQLYKREEVQAGLTTYDLESGYYVIRFADGHSYKVFIE